MYKLNHVYPSLERRLVSTLLIAYQVRNWFQRLLLNGSTCAAPAREMVRVQGNVENIRVLGGAVLYTLSFVSPIA